MRVCLMAHTILSQKNCMSIVMDDSEKLFEVAFYIPLGHMLKEKTL